MLIIPALRKWHRRIKSLGHPFLYMVFGVNQATPDPVFKREHGQGVLR